MLAAIFFSTRPVNSKEKFNLFIKHNSIFSSRLDFSKKLIPGNLVCYTKKINMSGLVRTRLSDEKIEAFEQEALIDESAGVVPSGVEATLNSLSKWAMAVILGAIVLWRHDAGALWVYMGSILNAGLSVILKRVLNQERPVSGLRSDPGMPSSHAQSMFFIVTFLILSMVECYQLTGATTILGAVIILIGGYFSWLRVSQKLHTVSQVAVGALLGSVFSCLWYWSWNAIVLDVFESSLSVRIVVVLGATVIFLAFFAHVIRYWVMDEQ